MRLPPLDVVPLSPVKLDVRVAVVGLPLLDADREPHHLQPAPRRLRRAPPEGIKYVDPLGERHALPEPGDWGVRDLGDTLRKEHGERGPVQLHTVREVLGAEPNRGIAPKPLLPVAVIRTLVALVADRGSDYPSRPPSVSR